MYRLTYAAHEARRARLSQNEVHIASGRTPHHSLQASQPSKEYQPTAASGAIVPADDPMVRRILLKRAAMDGLEALEMVKDHVLKNGKENAYILIFMDCNMPRKDGYQAS